MKKKIIFLAINNMDDGDFAHKAFENENDVIDFCIESNKDPDQCWSWHKIIYYHR